MSNNKYIVTYGIPIPETDQAFWNEVGLNVKYKMQITIERERLRNKKIKLEFEDLIEQTNTLWNQIIK